MKCVVLAAGEGKRMHPLTYTRPKVMLPIGNKPLLEWNLCNAIDAGFKEFIFVISYKSEMIRNYFGHGEKWNVKIDYIRQGKPKGTGHAIRSVEKFVNEFLVLCGDTIFGSEDIANIGEKKNCMGLYRVNTPKEYGIVDVKDGDVVKVYEKMGDPFTNIINGGMYHFDKKIFDYVKKIEKSPRGEYELTDAINILAKNQAFRGIMLQVWRDVVYPWDLLDANTEILMKQTRKIEGNAEKNTIMNGNVRIGKKTRILSGSYIEGPVVIGDNCKIGPNCYIRPYTSIGNSCHIGNACEIKNSIIMHSSKVPHHNYIGDSIIGENCNLGSGTKIANLRLDKKAISAIVNGRRINTQKKKLGVLMGDNVQTGVNCMVNVGTSIGNDVLVGPGAMVQGYVRPFSTIR